MGAGGNTLVWYNQVPYFAKDHTVVTFDHRDWGRSTCAPEDKHAKFFADELRRCWMMLASSGLHWYASPWAAGQGCTSLWIIQAEFRGSCCRARLA